MSTGNIILTSIVWLAAILAIVDYFALNKDVQKDNYGKMKKRLLKLLKEDGFKCEMEEGVILLQYHQGHFRIHFSASAFGKRYARVTVVDDYVMDGMEDIHPFIMDSLMGRASYSNSRISNISFDKYCTCFSGTDVHKVKDFYRGLRGVLDSLIENEQAVRKWFVKYHEDFGEKKGAGDKSHIGFRPSSEEVRGKEPKVAAETNVITTD